MLLKYSFVECPVSFKENTIASLLSADIFSIFIARKKKKKANKQNNNNRVQGHFIISLLVDVRVFSCSSFFYAIRQKN